MLKLKIYDISFIISILQDDWGSIDSNKLQQRIKQFKNETKDRAKKSKRKLVLFILLIT